MRRLLHDSQNADINGLYDITKHKYLHEDYIIKASKTKKHGSKLLQTAMNGKVNHHLESLCEQSAIIKVLKGKLTGADIDRWFKLISPLCKNLFMFARKALIFCLANNSNLFRWKKSNSEKCNLCERKQTQLHVLSNCSVAANEKRYTWRHNNVLTTLSHYMMQLREDGYTIYVDLEGKKNPAGLFKTFRPDMVIRKNDDITVIEYTIFRSLIGSVK